MLIKALVINFVKDLVNDLISLPDPMEKDVELLWGYLYPLFETQVWTGTDVVALFQIHGFGPETFSSMNQHLNKVLAEWQTQV